MKYSLADLFIFITIVCVLFSAFQSIVVLALLEAVTMIGLIWAWD